MTSPQNQQRRGWVAFGAGVFLIVFMGAIWIWIDRTVAAGVTVQDPAMAAFMGRINLACALVVVAGILGTVNGWMMAHSGRRNNVLIFAMIVVFAAALFTAYTASNAYHGG
jgi:cytochrome c oxidase assembly factor CtaG